MSDRKLVWPKQETGSTRVILERRERLRICIYVLSSRITYDTRRLMCAMTKDFCKGFTVYHRINKYRGTCSVISKTKSCILAQAVRKRDPRTTCFYSRLILFQNVVSLDFIEEESELFVRVSVSVHGVPFCLTALRVITEILLLT